jgi:hypothetical protein
MQQETLASTSVDVAVGDVIEEYFERGWTDGLPVVPATEERVREFLAACGKRPSDVVGVVPTRGRVITAEKIAINAVMAGCKPEYMPVVVAIIEAMTEPEFNYHGALASTGGSAQLIVVNGPVAEAIGINGAVNAFGPGFRANATIGRAIRLIIINVTTGTPGLLDRSTLGHGGKYSFCFTENMEASPWEPLHVQRGFSPDESAVTVVAVEAPHQISDHISNTPERLLDSMAHQMSVHPPGYGEYVVVVVPEHALIFRNAGWSKRQAVEYLFSKAVSSTGHPTHEPLPPGTAPEEKPVMKSADGIIMLVAGGNAGGFSALIPTWGSGNISRSVTKRVVV